MSYTALAVILGPAMNGVTELDPARYFATHGFTSRTTDAIPDQYFDSRIAEDIEYLREVSVVFWGQTGSRSTLGAIQLIASDGGIDDLRTAPIRDRTIEIYGGEPGDSFDNWTLLASAVSDRLECPSLDRFVLVPADRSAVLDRPIQSAVYSGANNSAIDGQTKPVLVGTCYSIPALLVHKTNLDYDIHDEAPSNNIRVRFNGVERTETTEWQDQGNGFRALISPESFRVTCDSTGEAVTSLPDVLSYMLTDRGPLDSGDLDTGTIDGLDAETEYQNGYFADRPVTYKQFLVELMAGYGGSYWFNRENKFAIGRLQDATSMTSALTITESSIDSDGVIAVDQDRAPGYSNICAGQRNWYVHQPNEIASSLTDPTYLQIAADLQQDYRIRKAGVSSGSGDVDAGQEAATKEGANIQLDSAGSDRSNRNTGIGTLLNEATHIQSEATRWVRLYEKRRSFWTVPVLLDVTPAAAALEPFQCVTLHFDADPPIPGLTGRHGLDTAKKLQVVGVRGRFLSGRVELRLWG